MKVNLSLEIKWEFPNDLNKLLRDPLLKTAVEIIFSLPNPEFKSWSMNAAAVLKFLNPLLAKLTLSARYPC